MAFVNGEIDYLSKLTAMLSADEVKLDLIYSRQSKL